MYGPVKIVTAGKVDLQQRDLTAREVTDRDAARAARAVEMNALAARQKARADDIAAIGNATPEELRVILMRLLV